MSNLHRFWRILCDSNVYGSYPCITEIRMASSTGGTNLIGSGTASASATAGGTTAAMACDGNAVTYWNGVSAYDWWKYDFGSNVSVSEVVMLPRPDVPSTTPGVWELQYSDDNANFLTLQSFLSGAWANGISQTFDVTSPSGTSHRWWRIAAQTSANGILASFSEISLANSVGGTNLIGSGTASSPSSYFTTTPSNATDGNPSTWWGSSALPGFFIYDFGSGNSYQIVEVKLTARNDAYYNQTPLTFTLDYSDDGSTWRTLQLFSATSWSSGQTQTFDVSSGGSGGSNTTSNTSSNSSVASPKSQADFAEAFIRLLPPGGAFPIDYDSSMREALYPLANTYATNELLAWGLITDSFPATTVQLIPEWNDTLGLPGACALEITENTATQQAAIVAQLNNEGGVSTNYYINLANTLGYSITVEPSMGLRIGHDLTWGCRTDPFEDEKLIITILSGSDPAYLDCILRQRVPAEVRLYIIYPDNTVSAPPELLYPLVSVSVSGTTATFKLSFQYMLMSAVNYSGTGVSGQVIFPAGSVTQTVTVPSSISLTLSNSFNCTI